MSIEQITQATDELGGGRSRFDIDADLRVYLAKTDWYVIRELETGTPVPEEIKTNRARVRAMIETPLPLPF
jgi:hypothetical protein